MASVLARCAPILVFLRAVVAAAPAADAPSRSPLFQRPFDLGAMRVEVRDSRYRAAPGVRPGRFASGQGADLMLSGVGFNDSGGPLLFNHPTGLASDGRRLLVADRWNNRILIWKQAPASNVAPDIVLGQPDFRSNDPGAGRAQLNWPGNVAISPDGKIVAVADTNNDRVLIWNSIPASSGAPASVEIALRRLAAPGSRRLAWPWGVWTDGRKFAAVATHGASVLIWNSLPERDDQPPDFTLQPQAAGTPRTITGDGTFLALSDHNYGAISRPATMVWRSFPSTATQAPDYVWAEWLKGIVLPGGRLLMAGPARLYVWNRVPSAAETDADVRLRPSAYRNGDGPDVAVAGGRMYACNYNGNNILAWNTIPERDDAPPDFSVGSDRPDQDTLKENFFLTNPVVATDGTSLFASSDFDRRLLVWRRLPDESGAKPDLVYSLPEGPWDNALHGQRLALAGQRTIYIWKRLPVDGGMPDTTFEGGIGSVRFQSLTGVALDERHLYVADREAGRVYAWKGIPEASDEPVWAFEMARPGRLASDGKYLAVAPFEGWEVRLFRVDALSADATPVVLGGRSRFNLPGKCVPAGGRLFVVDTSNHRIHVWNRIEDAIAGQAADALLGAGNDPEPRPAIGRNGLFMPGTVAFGGGYLWVAEFKFSGRILRFSPRAGSQVAPSAPP